MGRIRTLGWEMLDVHLDDLCAEPAGQLATICGYLDLEPTDDYLAACAEQVMPQPNPSLLGRNWTKHDLRRMRNLMDDLPWLQRYGEFARV